MKRKWMGVWLLLLIASIMLLAGCGKKDDTITIFMSDKESASREAIDQIQKKLDTESPDLHAEFNYSPLFDLQKVLVEYAAGGNSIVILPEDTIKTYSEQGAHVPLEDYFDKSKYKAGVFEGGVFVEGEDDPVMGEHLFGIPVEDLKMFKDSGYAPKGMLACVLVNSSNQEAAIKVLKKLAEG